MYVLYIGDDLIPINIKLIIITCLIKLLYKMDKLKYK